MKGVLHVGSSQAKEINDKQKDKIFQGNIRRSFGKLQYFCEVLGIKINLNFMTLCMGELIGQIHVPSTGRMS